MNHDKAILTQHAGNRMNHRRISTASIDLVIEYGRVVFTRGAMIYAIGRNEVERYKKEKVDLSDCEGIQVVCSLDDVVLTVYRNRNFRGLRTGLGRGRFRRDKRRIMKYFTCNGTERVKPGSNLVANITLAG